MDMILIGIIAGVCIAFPTAFIYAVTTSVKNWKADNRQKKQDKADGIKRFSAVEHVDGLDIVEKTPCSVVIGPSNLIISCTGKEYTLPLRKITYVDYLADVEKIRYLQSSVAKGIVGGVLFGVSGAVIGTAPKTKLVNETTGYAVIGYRDASGKEKIIILRNQPTRPYTCSLLVNELKSCIRTTIEKVEL